MTLDEARLSSDRWRPDDLVVQASDMALTNIAALANSGGLDLSPRFQRRNRWDRERQSQLIESFILNAPVPPVYLAEERRGRFAVIDGKQRLTAISEFFNDQFRLTTVPLLQDLEGARFSDLPASLVGTLTFRPLRAVTVLRQTPDWIKYEVFLRLNTGGQPLNAQEIRNVAFPGLLNDRLIELSNHDFLRKQLKIRGKNSPAYAAMTDVEYVLRFFTMSEYWHNLGGSLRGALDKFMIENRDADERQVAGYNKKFDRAITRCEAMWGELAFRRYDGKQWRDQMIGGVYDAEMVAVDLAHDDVLDRVLQRRRQLLAATAKLFSSPEFDASVRLSTNTSTRVRYRIESITEMLHQVAA